MSNLFTFNSLESSAAFFRTENIANYYYWLSADLAEYMEGMGSDLTGQNLEIAIERHNALVYMEHLTKTFWKDSKSRLGYKEHMLNYMHHLQFQSKTQLEEYKPRSHRLYTESDDVKASRMLDQVVGEINYIKDGYAPYADIESLDYKLTMTVLAYEGLLVCQMTNMFLNVSSEDPERELVQLFENLIGCSSRFAIECKTLFADRYREKLLSYFKNSALDKHTEFEEYLDRYLRVLASWDFVFQTMIESCQMLVHPGEVEFNQDTFDMHALATEQMSYSSIDYYEFLASFPSDLDIEILKPFKEKCTPHSRFEEILTTWRSAYGI